MEKTGKILIVDGHGLAFRAFYAVPPLSAPDGTPTNAITGFMNMPHWWLKIPGMQNIYGQKSPALP